MSYLGSTKIGKLFLGSTELSKAYLGNTLIFQKGGGGGGGGDLPPGGIQCEVIYGDGYNVYLESGLIPQATMSYEVDVCWVQPQIDAQQAPFGFYYPNDVRYNPIARDPVSLEPGYGNYYTGNWPTVKGILRCKHKAVVTPNGTTIETYTPDGQTLLNSQTFSYSQAITFTHTMALLGKKTSDSSILGGSWRGGLGRLKCYGDDHYGTLVADFNPCYYNGNFGVWETVAQRFIAGTTPSLVQGFGSHWGTEGFYPNTKNEDHVPPTYPDFLTDDRDMNTTRLFEVPAGCTSVQMRAAASAGGSYAALMCLASDKSWIDWYSYNAADRVVTLPSGTAFVRLSFYKNDMANCYLKDYTHNTYFWKGQNVI